MLGVVFPSVEILAGGSVLSGGETGEWINRGIKVGLELVRVACRFDSSLKLTTAEAVAVIGVPGRELVALCVSCDFAFSPLAATENVAMDSMLMATKIGPMVSTTLTFETRRPFLLHR
jgi:hypothetical protein